MISLIEYTIHLSTGETVEISEIDPKALDGFWDETLETEATELLEWCAKVSRRDMEDAKIGYDNTLKQKLRSPIESLLRLNNPVCSSIESCSMAKRTDCTLRNMKRGIGKFPICFDWGYGRNFSSKLTELSHVVIHSWRMNRFVIFVE